MHDPTDRIAHTTAFVTPVVEHWLYDREMEEVIGEKRTKKLTQIGVLIN